MASIFTKKGRQERRERRASEKTIVRSAFKKAFEPARKKFLEQRGKAKAVRKARRLPFTTTVGMFVTRSAKKGGKKTAKFAGRRFIALVKDVTADGGRRVRVIDRPRKKSRRKVSQSNDLFFGSGGGNIRLI